ncbi:hypothetical protein J6590_030030 [Homalodisca vitripennis]|nr:hypothetical protein J6590_030030 [Homalodisca vitripennis]
MVLYRDIILTLHYTKSTRSEKHCTTERALAVKCVRRTGTDASLRRAHSRRIGRTVRRTVDALSHGSHSSTLVEGERLGEPRALSRLWLRAQVVLGHHPSVTVTPSNRDLSVTVTVISQCRRDLRDNTAGTNVTRGVCAKHVP